jgi:hypothetical protein
MRLPHRRRAFAWMLAVLACAAVVGGVLASAHERDEPVAHATFNGFGVDRWPDATWRPYAHSSPFNRPIPADVRVHPDSARIVKRILAFGDPSPAPIQAGTSGTADDYSHPTYYARRSDPLYVLRPDDRGEPLLGQRIHIPAAARPATGDDAHLTVVQPDGWEYDFWRVWSKPRGGGVLRYSLGSRTRIDGSGLEGRATAAQFSTLAGIVRAPELEAGTIDHALFLVVSCLNRSRSFGDGVRLPRHDEDKSSYVYPASDGGALCDRDYRFLPPMGARLQLAMSPEEIDALGLPAWKTGVLKALATYGGYVGDTGGPGFAVMTESGLTYTSYGRPDPLLAFGRAAYEAGDAYVSEYQGRYLFDLADGVDWARYLRVVAPPPRR